ncbi:MAG: FAD-dependent oxidoreductase [Pirellulaceae bacterium]
MQQTIIIGGGIIGLAIAEKLSSDGNRNVTVVDHCNVANTASWAAAGVLPPPLKNAKTDPLEQLRQLAHPSYDTWVSHLESASGIDIELQNCGGLYVAIRPGEVAALRAAVAEWQFYGVDIREVPFDSLAEFEPALRPLQSPAAVFFSPEEKLVRPTRILKALRAILDQRSNVVRMENVRATAVRKTSDQRIAVHTSADVLTADQVCVATGPWALELLADYGMPPLYVEARRGQMIMWQLEQPLVRHVINEGPRYLFARTDGLLLAGSTVEEEQFDCSTTDAGIAELTNFAVRLVPELERHSIVKSWAGLRPSCHDGAPYIGALKSLPNCFVAAGHFRSGIHLAAITAECLAAVMSDETPPIEMAPYDPLRP